MSYVYLIKVREFFNTNIIKVGRTKNYKQRIKNYPQKSFYIKVCSVDNCNLIENKLKKEFNIKFKIKYGTEYFAGNENEIIETFINIIKLFNNNKLIYLININNNIIINNNDNNTINNSDSIINNRLINNINNDNNTTINNNDITINNNDNTINNFYKCNNCNYKTESENFYKRHINKKKPCISSKIDINCEYCNIKFGYINNYYKHKKHSCKILKQQQINNKKVLNISKKKLELKERKIKIKKKELKNNKIKINNTTNNINIVTYGKEDMSIIDKEDLKSIFKDDSLNSIQKLFELVNFNEKYPKNHNIFFNNLKNGHVKIYNGKTWVMYKYSIAFFLILNKKIIFLKNKLNEMINEIDTKIFINFNIFINQINNNTMQQNLKLFLYNNRHYAKRTHKL